MDEDRELGPEMQADGWLLIGGDSIMWCHPPSHRVVLVDGPWKRETYRAGWEMAPGEPEAPEVYAVSCYRAYEDGEPTGEYDGFLTASYAKALKTARETRARLLAEQQKWEQSDQVTFDDLLERKVGGA